MNCKNFTIKVTEGNAFTLVCPLTVRTWENHQPIDTPVDCRELISVAVRINGQEWSDFSKMEDGIYIQIPADMPKATYNVEIVGVNNGYEVRAAYYECFAIVPWQFQSNAEQFDTVEPIVLPSVHLLSGGTGGGGGDATLANQEIIIDAILNSDTTTIAELLDQEHGLAALRAILLSLASAVGHIPTTEPSTANDVNAAKQAILDAIASAKADIIAALPAEATEQEIDNIFNEPSES